MITIKTFPSFLLYYYIRNKNIIVKIYNYAFIYLLYYNTLMCYIIKSFIKRKSFIKHSHYLKRFIDTFLILIYLFEKKFN
jgi:hypothetical protein